MNQQSLGATKYLKKHQYPRCLVKNCTSGNFKEMLKARSIDYMKIIIFQKIVPNNEYELNHSQILYPAKNPKLIQKVY